MQTLLVGWVCHACAGFASRHCWWKPRAALAEARLPWATLCRPFRAHEGCRRKAARVRNCVLFKCHSCHHSCQAFYSLPECHSCQAFYATSHQLSCYPLPEGARKVAGGAARLGEREPPDHANTMCWLKAACRRYARTVRRLLVSAGWLDASRIPSACDPEWEWVHRKVRWFPLHRCAVSLHHI